MVIRDRNLPPHPKKKKEGKEKPSRERPLLLIIEGAKKVKTLDT